MINQVILLGKIIKDLEFKYVGAGTLKTTMTVVTSKAYKKDNETKYKDAFHRVTFWGESWEWLQKRVLKDSQVYIEAELEYSSYEKNGEKIYSTDIIGHKVMVVNGNK